MKVCDFCSNAVDEYVDGKFLPTYQWANMCMSCWKKRGVGRFGTGIAQHYRKIDGKFVKIAG